MKAIAKIVGSLLVLCILAGIGMYVYGATLPETHSETLSVELNAPKDRVWTLITDYRAMPSWWSDVKAVEEVTRPDGLRVSWSTDKHGQKIGFITLEERPTEKLMRKILDDGLPFGGTWTYELSDAGSGKTRLTVLEEGFIRPPFVRAFAKIFMGPRSTLESFGAAIKGRAERPL